MTTELLERADAIAAEAHRGQLDKAGEPYIGHPRRVARAVASRGGSVHEQAAALLHDVLEDTPVTPETLAGEGVPQPVVRAVIALTKREGEPYEQAVERAAGDPIARLVKLCDIEDNLDPERLALLDSVTRRRLQDKYRSGLAVLDHREVSTGDARGVARSPGSSQHPPANDSPGSLPSYLAEMVRREPPTGTSAYIVEGSTPVVAFGDPGLAEVATLGINPSRREFLGDDGRMLSGAERRLATLASLGAKSLASLSDEQVAGVVADCKTYFDRNPYRGWFDPLDALLRESTATSYYDGSACHLDLVQWATDPVWSQITDAAIANDLLADGAPLLRQQLQYDNVRLVLLNGRSVLKQVEACGLVQLDVVDVIRLGERTFELVAGSRQGVRWIGWSVNLQGSFGVSNEFRDALAGKVADLCRSESIADSAASTADRVEHPTND